MKKCILESCKQEIPKTRKKSSKYCSDECYYEAKKERSSRSYAALKAPMDEIKRNEHILSCLYGISQMNKPINTDDLSRYDFNFSLSTGEHFDAKKGLCKIIGKYAYSIATNKTITIWKLK